MKGTRLNLTVGAGAMCLLVSGCAPAPVATDETASEGTEVTPLVERVLTREEQEQLTPDEVLTALKEGNQRFLAGTVTARDHSAQVREAATGQYPKAVVLSCLDSRVPVEDVFDRGIGDIFVARVAGNFENTDIVGSMEFACRVAGAKLILVLGHGYCGAVKSAIDGVELGNITAMLENIQAAVGHFEAYEGEKTGENDEFVRMVTEQNVRRTIDDIRETSPILKEMEDNAEIKFVGAVYDIYTGRVGFLD